MNSKIVALAVVSLGLTMSVITSAAQSSYLQPGTVQITGANTGCNTGVNGLNADDRLFTYGYLKPSGVVHGTVVFFPGGPGTSPTESPDDASLVGSYFGKGYEIVKVAWQTDWQDAHGTTGGNIQSAACRPAAFLQYVYNTPLLYSSGTGMCAQGASAGAGAVAYSLAWYGAGNFLDKAELLSGPVFSDIEQGCEEGPPPLVQVCRSSDSWCQGGTQGEWDVSPTYISHYATEV